MIDLHTHILPRIDDGSQSVEESCALLADLAAQGVDSVVFTPHYYGIRHGVEQFLERRANAYKVLTGKYDGDIKLHLGCECNIAKCTNFNFDDLVPLAIDQKQYILTEMSFEPEWDSFMWNRLDSLLQTGLTPLIAHVELYPAVRKNPSFVARLISLGCVIQVNCDSVVADDLLVKVLIEHEQVHCIGSDTHNTTKRPPKYAAAAQKIKVEHGDGVLQNIQDNMRCVIDGKKFAVTVGSPVKRTLFGKYK